MIHAPSLAIGAAMASAAIIVVFLGFEGVLNQQELEIQPTPRVPQAESQITMSTFLDNGSPILGDPNAPVTLVEFGDYQCHFCNVFFHSTEGKILENYIDTGKVRMIFKDFNIIGQDSVSASHGAHCAGDQGMFWEYHDILYSNWTGENNGWASQENLEGFAKEVGLDFEVWSECFTEKPHSERIFASNSDAQSLDLTGTPAFFVIGTDGKTTRLFGAQPYATFEQVFEEELKK